MTEPRTIFTLRIAGKTGQAGIHRLRAVLKELLRRHDFVCLDAREVCLDAHEEHIPDASKQAADALVQLHHDVGDRLRWRS